MYCLYYTCRSPRSSDAGRSLPRSSIHPRLFLVFLHVAADGSGTLGRWHPPARFVYTLSHSPTGHVLHEFGLFLSPLCFHFEVPAVFFGLQGGDDRHPRCFLLFFQRSSFSVPLSHLVQSISHDHQGHSKHRGTGGSCAGHTSGVSDGRKPSWWRSVLFHRQLVHGLGHTCTFPGATSGSSSRVSSHSSPSVLPVSFSSSFLPLSRTSHLHAGASSHHELRHGALERAPRRRPKPYVSFAPLLLCGLGEGSRRGRTDPKTKGTSFRSNPSSTPDRKGGPTRD